MITGEKADLRQILTVRDLRVAYGQRGGGVWHALNGVSFGVGAGEIVAGVWGGVGGVWVGEKHVGGEFVAAAAGERTDYVRGDSAGRGGYRPNGCRAASPHAWEWRVDCFSRAVAGVASDDSNR